MIHTVRKNETAEDIQKIFECPAEKLRTMCVNAPKNLTEGMSIFAELGYLPAFDDKTLRLTKNSLFTHAELKLSCIYKPQSNEESFVGADVLTQNAHTVYIDGYNVSENVLNLPYDYPAINACLIAGLSPAFMLSEPKIYAEEGILNQLLHDLSFKEYTRCLITARKDEAEAVKTLAEALNASGIAVDIAAPQRALTEIFPKVKANKYFYRVERNVLDFDSFTNNIKALASLTEGKLSGCVLTPKAARINKSTGKVDFPDMKNTEEDMRLCAEDVRFDEGALLSHFSYKKGEEEFNLIFEDYRALYAKLSFLLKQGFTEILAEDENTLRIIRNVASVVK